ncbi:Venom allergen 5, partial [Stegodyphus mimosarum]
MLFLFGCSLVFSILAVIKCQQCPDRYKRYSVNHSFCKPQNRTCSIVIEGVRDNDKYLILDLHNKYRSKVAQGLEKRAGGLPQASNMMQLFWDKELEAVATNWAKQCIYKHDCSDCRKVENFAVGQNIGYIENYCPSRGKCDIPQRNWTGIIQLFYDEVAIFPKRFLSNMQFVGESEYGHFTQMVWADTWKIGCGYIVYKNGNAYRQFFVCNYGPQGNILNQPMYKPGLPCTGCPSNSCCGNGCKHVVYPGLCQMKNPYEAPIYPPEGKYLFSCNFMSLDGDCKFSTTPGNRWSLRSTLSGKYIGVTLPGGSKAIIDFSKPIKAKSNTFCITINYRKGPIIAGKADTIKVKVHLEAKGLKTNDITLEPETGSDFFRHTLFAPWNAETKISIILSVPAGSKPQYFDLQSIFAQEGKCK